MFLESFKITGLAVVQIFIMGCFGYFLMKKRILGDAGLDALSRLAIDITFPLMIFCQLIRDFSFTQYPDWWIFPLLSLGITILALIIGGISSVFISGSQHKLQFLSLVVFQNSGWLPLALVAALLPKDQANPMFIYLFLFLLGFNLIMFSLGTFILAFSRQKKFEVGSFFSPPVIATLITMGLVFLGINRFVPEFIFKPLKMIGDCTLPLAMLVVGGNIAQIRLTSVDKKAMALMVAVKLVILPLLGILIMLKFNLPFLIGLLVLIQLAMPSATTLSVLVRFSKKEDLLVSQGIFFGHIFSLISIPVFLSWYFMLGMIK